MPAGLNRVCNVWRFTNPTDDAVGGSVPTGTVLYYNIDIRIKAEKPSMPLLEQGIEVPTIYSAFLFEGNIEIQHNDQIEFTLPVKDWYYGKKFRIVGIQRSGNHPAHDRNQIHITLRRWETSHSNNLQ